MSINSNPTADLAAFKAELQKFINNTRYHAHSAGDNDVKDATQATHSPNNEDNDSVNMEESVKEAIHSIYEHAHQLLLLIRKVPCLQEDEYPPIGQGVEPQQGRNPYLQAGYGPGPQQYEYPPIGQGVGR